MRLPPVVPWRKPERNRHVAQGRTGGFKRHCGILRRVKGFGLLDVQSASSRSPTFKRREPNAQVIGRLSLACCRHAKSLARCRCRWSARQVEAGPRPTATSRTRKSICAHRQSIRRYGAGGAWRRREMLAWAFLVRFRTAPSSRFHARLLREGAGSTRAAGGKSLAETLTDSNSIFCLAIRMPSGIGIAVSRRPASIRRGVR
jgi:hypothetical protein